MYEFHKTEKDASLRDANDLTTDFSTERGIPNGMQADTAGKTNRIK